jgi:hypothetical protein
MHFKGNGGEILFHTFLPFLLLLWITRCLNALPVAALQNINSVFTSHGLLYLLML